MNIPTGTQVRIEIGGGLIYDGLRIILTCSLKPGLYRVVEDLGKKITLQPWRGGENVTAWKL